MQAYAGDRDVFIRSMAARGHAGGLASTTGAACAILDAVGFDLILVETVGTGQSEVEVASSADTTVVLEAPEMGDEVQAIKAGLLEVADLVVVNKGDRPGAQRTAAQLRAMLVAAPVAAVDPGTADGPSERPRPKRPEVLVTTAATGEGVPELLAALDRHRSTVRGADGGSRGSSARLTRADAQVRAILAERMADRLRSPRLAAEAGGDASGGGRSRAGPLRRRRSAAGGDRTGGDAMTIERVFVAGAGLMGHGIAQVHASIGKTVDLYEPQLARATAGRERIAGEPRAIRRQGPARRLGARRHPGPDPGDRRLWPSRPPPISSSRRSSRTST